MRLPAPIALLAGVVALAGTAVAASPFDQASFRYSRTLSYAGNGPVFFEPDARVYAHAKPGFADLRVVMPDGSQVPWRLRPEEKTQQPEPATVLYQGRQNDRAVGLLDTGAPRTRIDRLALDVPDRGFVGRVEVLGSDDRKDFVKLSTTVIYDIAGATAAHSTTAVFPPADFRYYLVRASGVDSVTGATIERGGVVATPLVRRALRSTHTTQNRRTTVIVADLGFRRVPVDVLRIATTTPLFDRAVLLDGSNDRRTWAPVAVARLSRLPDSVTRPIDVAADQRYLRVTISNGDDVPLEHASVTALARSRAIIVRGGGPAPLRLLYGNARAAEPQYDDELLPASALRLNEAVPARLGAEVRTPPIVRPPQARSFLDRYPWLVGMLLAVAALAIGAGGLAAALRPRPPDEGGQRGGAAMS